MRKSLSLFDPALVVPAIAESFRKLSPAVQLGNPVMFVVYVGSLMTTLLFVQALRGQGEAPAAFILAITAWLWFTLLFANFAEALAEGRSKAQAASLRGLKQSIQAKKMKSPQYGAECVACPAPQLRKGDVFLVEAGDVIPADGEVIDGVASVDESAITGESAPVVRESGGDFCAVTGGYQADRHDACRVASGLGEDSAAPPQWGVFGEPRVNVLMLNLDLDRAQ